MRPRGAPEMNMVQLESINQENLVTKGNNLGQIFIFWPSGKVWGHIFKSTAPLHPQVSIFKILKENERKLEKMRGCNLSAIGVHLGAVLVQEKRAFFGLHQNFSIKNQRVMKNGAVVQSKKCPIDCHDGRQLHPGRSLRGSILKIGNICQKSGFCLFLRGVKESHGVQVSARTFWALLGEKYLLPGFFISLRIVWEGLKVVAFSSISVVRLWRGGKQKAENEPKKAKRVRGDFRGQDHKMLCKVVKFYIILEDFKFDNRKKSLKIKGLVNVSSDNGHYVKFCDNYRLISFAYTPLSKVQSVKALPFSIAFSKLADIRKGFLWVPVVFYGENQFEKWGGLGGRPKIKVLWEV